MLKKWESFNKDWDLIQFKSMVNFSIRPDKVKKLIQLIVDDKKARDMVRTIY